MKALQILELDGPDAMRLVSAPKPSADDGVLIEVHAAGVAFPDLLMTRGRYQVQPELPFAPGSEVAGVVVSAPPASGWAAGDRVCGFVPWGAFAEYAAVRPDQIFPLSDALDFVEGVAMTNNPITAYFALQVRTKLGAGEVLVVHGASGGVGSSAVQLGLALGAKVIAVVRGREKAEFIARAGPTAVIDLDVTEDWVGAVWEASDGHGGDFVFDPVGGQRFEDSLRALAPEGKSLVIGFAGGAIQSIPSNRLLLKNVDAVGVALGPRLVQEPQLLQELGLKMNKLIEDEGMRPLIGMTRPLAEGAEALREMESRTLLGKAVLVVRGEGA
jgi:NADPH2:quinone reductase